MRPKHVLRALAILAVTGAVTQSEGLADAWQGNESLIHKVQTDAYSGMRGGFIRGDSMLSKPAPVPGDQSRSTEEYKAGSPGNDGRYGANPSDNYLRKESSGSSSGPYGGSIYGGPPTTPSADPMIKELSRDPSMR